VVEAWEVVAEKATAVGLHEEAKGEGVKEVVG
jgi:hypothetical protein